MWHAAVLAMIEHGIGIQIVLDLNRILVDRGMIVRAYAAPSAVDAFGSLTALRAVAVVAMRKGLKRRKPMRERAV